MVKKYSLQMLQLAINHALNLDANFSEKLKTLEGKTLKIIITPLNVNFFIQFSVGQIVLLEQVNTSVDTVIESSPLGLIKLSLLPASKVRSIFNDDIKISGDVEFGQNIKKIFDEIDIDWESHLARFTGDVIAYQAGNFIRKSWQKKKQIVTSLHESMTEFLQEELRWFPGKEELNDFFQDIDELVLMVERISAHIKQIEQHENC